MPRLKRRRKQRRSDFERSLARFLADPARKMWFHGSRFVAIRTGEHEASLKDREAGRLVSVMLRKFAQPELLRGRTVVSVQEFMEGRDQEAARAES